jgi:hypothetical protein
MVTTIALATAAVEEVAMQGGAVAMQEGVAGVAMQGGVDEDR